MIKKLSAIYIAAVMTAVTGAFTISAQTENYDSASFVTSNADFPNGELIFNDKYSVAVEQGRNKKYLVVYNIDPLTSLRVILKIISK